MIVLMALAAAPPLHVPNVAQVLPSAVVRFLPGRAWGSGYCAPPHLCSAGDVDGDGRADVIALDPSNGDLTVVQSSAIGKPRFPHTARSAFAKGATGMAAGRFSGSPGCDVAALARDGLHVATAYGGDGSYGADVTLPPPPGMSDNQPAILTACPSAGRDGLVVITRTGAVFVGTFSGTGASITVAWNRQPYTASGATAVAVEPEGAGAPEVVWRERNGSVMVAVVGSSTQPRPLGRFPGPDRLLVGRFSHHPSPDLISGDTLLLGGDPAHAIRPAGLPADRECATDRAWLAGDFTGSGTDTILRVRHSGDRFTGDDVSLISSTDTAAMADGDGDGLPDAWETGDVKPGGLDLKALGCSPDHADAIVEVQPFANVDEKRLHAEMDRAVAYYAKLPVRNPDGKPGIALHVIFREPIPMSDAGKPWWELGDKYFPASHRGICHWMVVYHGGGGQSDQMADRGSCGDAALYAVFLHEFGHQVGLDHTGYFGPAWCPIYPSMMNYAYSYQLNGKGEDIEYSDGRLAGLLLDEHHLNEELPLPIDKVRFLAGPPYHYHLKPGPTKNTTLIDWNWNGIFGEKNIAADINYGYSTTGGNRNVVGKTYDAPAVCLIGHSRPERLIAFGIALPDGAKLPEQTATEPRASVDASNTGRLLAYVWRGRDRIKDQGTWDPAVTIAASGVIGDASAASAGSTAWVAYPAADGVHLVPVSSPDKGGAVAGTPVLVPGTAGASPTLAAYRHGLCLLLWRGPDVPLGTIQIATDGQVAHLSSERPLDATSLMPPGAAEGDPQQGGTALFVAITSNQDPARPQRWQVRRYRLSTDGILREEWRDWVGGENGREAGATRLAVLVTDEAGFPHGRVHVFGGGTHGKDSPWSCFYVAMQIADASVNGGWLTRRYYDEWTQTRSGPAVCAFRDDIALAFRWFGNVHATENDNLLVSFFGSGIESDKMGDFNDIALIRDTGLSHSILYAGN